LSEGEPLEKVVHYLEEARYRSGLIAALDTLDFLVQGGRIGKAAYLVGSALQIVPILSINKEGIVAPARIVNKRVNIISALISILKNRTAGFHKIHISVMHADARERAENLLQALHKLYPDIEIPIDEFTPVMGAHAGPGLVGLGYLYD